MKAVILAAGRGTRLAPLTNEIPKALVPVSGVPLLDRLITRIRAAGIDEIIVVSGCMHEVIVRHLATSSAALARTVRVVYNERYADWGNFYSLLVAREAVGDDGFVKCDGDVVLAPGVLERLLAAPGSAVLGLQRSETLGAEEMKIRVDTDGRMVALNKRMDPASAIGEFIGIERIDESAAPRVWGELQAMIDSGETDEYYERAYERLMGDIAFSGLEVSASMWCEIDDAADLEHAHQLAAQHERLASDRP